MIIDFHTHIWPDAIAPRAVAALTENTENLYKPVTHGTVAELVQRMDEWNIDLSVIQPVVTKQSQTTRVNDFAASLRSDRLISFGGMWPYTDDYKRDIDYIVSLGLPGIKLHPEYQGFDVDSPQMLKVYDYALTQGLMLLFHAGADPAYTPPFRSSPSQYAHIAAEMQGGVIIAAHLGGHAQWDDVEQYLAGTSVYLDTSMGFGYYSTEQFLRIAQKHGTDRILFASDSPWSNAHDEINAINALPLSPEQKSVILGDNARRLLHL